MWRSFKGYLELAAELQKPGERLSVSTTSAGQPEDWEAEKDHLVEWFGELAARAEELGVIVGVEPHVNQALCRPDQSAWIVEQVNSPGLRLHFDISHFNVQGDPMEQVIDQLAKYSAHTHVKDERGIAPDHQFLIPGEGDMDYVNYLKWMDRAGYRGYIAVEISLMVQARPDYDALAAATRSCAVVSKAFEEAGIARVRA
ncbi:MAG: sugar phosphate isomerase/epimerase [Thermomicrobiales bacterium]